MKVIDLLNKIAKSEELPKEVIYNQEKYTYKEKSYGYDYINEIYGGTGLFKGWCIDKILNDEVEIIEEEKEIEKLKIKDGKVIGSWENGSNYNYTLSAPQTVMINKINELIDEINELKSGKDE